MNQFSLSIFLSLFLFRPSSCTSFIRLPSMNEFENVKQSSSRLAAHPPIFGSDARALRLSLGEKIISVEASSFLRERTASHPVLFHIERLTPGTNATNRPSIVSLSPWIERKKNDRKKYFEKETNRARMANK